MPPDDSPATITFSVTEVVLYGLLAAAVTAGVLYAGGRSVEQIATVTGIIVALVALFAVIAPRARTPVPSNQPDGTEPAEASDKPNAAARPTNPSSETPGRIGRSHKAGQHGRRRRR